MFVTVRALRSDGTLAPYFGTHAVMASHSNPEATLSVEPAQVTFEYGAAVVRFTSATAGIVTVRLGLDKDHPVLLDVSAEEYLFFHDGTQQPHPHAHTPPFFIVI